MSRQYASATDLSVQVNRHFAQVWDGVGAAGGELGFGNGVSCRGTRAHLAKFGAQSIALREGTTLEFLGVRADWHTRSNAPRSTFAFANKPSPGEPQIL